MNSPKIGDMFRVKPERADYQIKHGRENREKLLQLASTVLWVVQNPKITNSDGETPMYYIQATLHPMYAHLVSSMDLFDVFSEDEIEVIEDA